MASTSNIFQLSEFQYDNMVEKANGKSPLLIVLEALETDEPDLKERLERQVREVKELEILGFVKDKTGTFLEKITSHKLQTGRGYLVYIITDNGFDMFHGTNKRKIN
jgi:hypothetical protein